MSGLNRARYAQADTYQIGNLFAALNLPIQQHLAAGHGYPFALGWTVGPALLAVIIATSLGTEAKGAIFGAAPAPAPAPAGAPGSPDRLGRP